MTTIQLPIDESLLTEVDRITQSLAMTRVDFFRQALKLALQKYEIKVLEKQHEESYARHPASPEEIAEWESEQVWEEP
jgi:metal-responsive CopG/Arc/MetJ family transcriptional regulator